MTIKDLKSEARQKLPVNMHQAVIIYTIEYIIFVSIVALIAIGGMCVANTESAWPAVIVIIYGCVLMLLAAIGGGMINYAMVDFYLASYRCKNYNVRRLGDVIARNGMTKILKLNLLRTVIGFLLLLLFIAPGLFYLSRTSMANHLLNANPKMKIGTALSASAKVMSGKLGTYLALMFSMTGWYVLGILTLGIGFIFVMPYINMVKSVYYKRNLQGDRAVYNIPVQPVSPPMEQQAMINNIPNTPVQPVQSAMGAPAQPVVDRPVPDMPIPPIATFNDAEMTDMNNAMHDIEGIPAGDIQADVPEVPISPPVSAHKPPHRPTHTPEPAPAAMPGEPSSHPLAADSNIVETVKPLTTQEADAANVFDERVNALFNGTPNKPVSAPHDYMFEQHTQNPNDFVTGDFDVGDDQTSAEEKPAEQSNSEQESVMNDAQFEEFLRAFDIPVLDSDGEITKPEHHDNTESEKPHEPETPPNARPTAGASPRPRPAANNEQQTAATPHESRLERARREREERLRNTRK